jgi:DNA-binding LacI/PurR family transcriptional regulator
MLLRLIAGEKFEPRHVVLEPQLRVRQSTARPR